MGQGTESCGGYEVDYCPHEDGLSSGLWTQRDGSTISVDRMSPRHLENARRMAERMVRECNFTGDAEMWEEWVEVFDRAIGATPARVPVYTTPAVVKQTRGAKFTMVCHCGAKYEARKADLDRGWGLSCSKRCASIRREFGRPAAKRAV